MIHNHNHGNKRIVKDFLHKEADTVNFYFIYILQSAITIIDI